MGGSDLSTTGKEGAYVGLFRPPGGEKSGLGFHMCVAIIPLRARREGAISAEEYLDQQPQRYHPEGPRGQEVWNMSPFLPLNWVEAERVSCGSAFPASAAQNAACVLNRGTIYNRQPL